MGIVTVKQTGSFAPTLMFLNRAKSREYLNQLDALGQKGVDALRAATPVDHGELAAGWSYVIVRGRGNVSIKWMNNVMAGTAPLAVLIQYGHGTRRGGYVQGRDFINPALRPIFDEIANAAWAALIQ